MDTKVQDFYCF